jgi:hypothetical protein
MAHLSAGACCCSQHQAAAPGGLWKVVFGRSVSELDCVLKAWGVMGLSVQLHVPRTAGRRTVLWCVVKYVGGGA